MISSIVYHLVVGALLVISVVKSSDININAVDFKTSYGGPDLAASLDKFLDQLISGVNSNTYSPLSIPDYNVTVDTDIIVVPIIGTLKFYNAVVTEIGQLSRVGEAAATYKDETLTLDLAVQVKNVQVTGDFIAKFELLGPSGSLSGTISDLQLQAAMTMDVKALKVTVTNFYMQAGSVDISLDILPVLNWFLNSLIKIIVVVIRWPLLSVISSDLRSTLQNFLDSYLQPLQ